MNEKSFSFNIGHDLVANTSGYRTKHCSPRLLISCFLYIHELEKLANPM